MRNLLLTALLIPMFALADTAHIEVTGATKCYTNQTYVAGSTTKCGSDGSGFNRIQSVALNYILANIAAPSQNRSYQAHVLVKSNYIETHYNISWTYNWNSQTQQGTWGFHEQVWVAESTHAGCTYDD